jgi:UDP-glucose 4-epimerase
MKIAITGACGYLGQLLARRLLAEPAVESSFGLDIVPGSLVSPKYQYQQADVLVGDFAELFLGIDAVYHLAFVVSPPENKSVEEIDKVNIVGSQRVFEGAAAAGVKKIIYSSSIAAYGSHADNPEVIDESCPRRPNLDWYYSRAKGAVEEFLDEFQRRHAETVVIRFRPSIFLGPTLTNPIAKIAAQPILVSVNPQAKHAFCWDEDVVDAFALALSYQHSDSFNLTGDGALNFDDIGKILGKRVFNIPFKLMIPWLRLCQFFKLVSPQTIEWVTVSSLGSIVVSAQKAKEKLGWKPRFDAAGTVAEFAKATAK